MSEPNGLRYSIDVGDSFEGELSAKLTSDSSEFSFELTDGEPRSYHGCDLFNNSFMPPPKFREEICLQSVGVIRYTGRLDLPQSVEDDLRAGILTLEPLSDTGRHMTGEIDRETPPRLSIEKREATNVLTWESDGRWTVEATESLGDSENWYMVTNVFGYGAENMVSQSGTNSGLFYRLRWQRSD